MFWSAGSIELYFDHKSFNDPGDLGSCNDPGALGPCNDPVGLASFKDPGDLRSFNDYGIFTWISILGSTMEYLFEYRSEIRMCMGLDVYSVCWSAGSRDRKYFNNSWDPFAIIECGGWRKALPSSWMLFKFGNKEIGGGITRISLFLNSIHFHFSYSFFIFHFSYFSKFGQNFQ